MRELLLFAALGCFTIAVSMVVTSGPAWLFLLIAAALIVTQSYTAARWLDAAELQARTLMGRAPSQYRHNDAVVRVDPIAPTVPIAMPQREVIVTVAADEVEVEPTALVTPPPPTAAPPRPRVTPQPSDASLGDTQAAVVEIRARVIGVDRPRQATLKQVLGSAMPVRSS